MSMLSKEMTNRLTISRTVQSSFKVHGPTIVTALEPALLRAGLLAKVDISALLAFLDDSLEHDAIEVRAADLANAAELANDALVRQERAGALGAVRDKLLGARDLMTGAYGMSVAAAYDLSSALPETPPLLLQRGQNVALLLTERPLTATPRLLDLKLDLKKLGGEIAALCERLAAALVAVQREQRAAQATLERKNRAGEAWQHSYTAVTYVAYGLYLLAGRRDLADRIEPTERRRRGLPDEPQPDEPTQPGPASPGADPSAGSVPSPTG